MHLGILVLIIVSLLNFEDSSAIDANDTPEVPAVIAEEMFDYGTSHFVVQLIPTGKTSVRPGVLPCGSGEVKEGDFTLMSDSGAIVLRNDSKELAKINVDYIEVERKKSDSNWHLHGEAPLFLLRRDDKLPLIVVARYGACLWMDYSVYWLEQNKGEFSIKPLKFRNPTGSECVGEDSNVLYAESIEISFDQDRRRDVLWVNGYDNSLEGRFTSQFMEDFEPGTWRCVGHHSDMTPRFKFRDEELQ